MGNKISAATKGVTRLRLARLSTDPVRLTKGEMTCSVHLAHLLMLVLGCEGSLLALEESLAVLVKLQSGDNAVRGVDGDVRLLSVGLLLDELLNVDAPLATVNFSDFALTVLVGPTDDFDGVAITNGNRAGLVLRGQLFAQLGGHHSPTE